MIGHRLYREIRKTEVTQPRKGKPRGSQVLSSTSYQWEAVATNFDEFQDVSVSFCFSWSIYVLVNYGFPWNSENIEIIGLIAWSWGYRLLSQIMNHLSLMLNTVHNSVVLLGTTKCFKFKTVIYKP
jgi:hypothetical protein